MTKEGKEVVLWAGMIPFMMFLNLFSAIWAMLGLGVLHSWYPGIPAFGYWETYLVLCLGHIALRLIRPIRFSEFKK